MKDRKYRVRTISRSPLGLRGLKFLIHILYSSNGFSRSPLGLRGLKSLLHLYYTAGIGRSPLGLRGLKYSALPINSVLE